MEKADLKPSDSEQVESKFKEEFQASVQSVEEHVEDFREAIQKYNRKVVDVVTERPVVAIAAAFVLGYAVGKLAAHRWFV